MSERSRSPSRSYSGSPARSRSPYRSYSGSPVRSRSPHRDYYGGYGYGNWGLGTASGLLLGTALGAAINPYYYPLYGVPYYYPPYGVPYRPIRYDIYGRPIYYY